MRSELKFTPFQHCTGRNHTYLNILPHSARFSDLDVDAPALQLFPALFCTAHTHVPYIRKIANTLIVNSGSVCAPCNGDTRLSHARLTWIRAQWSPETVRLSYDRQETGRHYTTSGYLESGIDARLVYHEWRTARRMFPTWHREFKHKVQDGALDEETAVDLLVRQVLSSQ
ncbi:MAG: metallophosphoesterase family protein [Caldilineaceae bacterium]